MKHLSWWPRGHVRVTCIPFSVACIIIFCSFTVSGCVVTSKEKPKEAKAIATNEAGEELTREAQKALYEAQEAIKIDRYVAARNFLVDYFAALTPEEQLLEENVPVMYYYMLAQTWIAEDNLEEARKVYKEGLVRYPNDDAMEINFAITTYNTERFAEAAPLFEKLYDTRQGDKKDSRYLQQAAAAYYQIESLKEAKRVLKRMFALPEEPKPEWFQMIIQICMEQEEMKEAESYVRQYLVLVPVQPDYRHYRRLLEQLKQLGKGEYTKPAWLKVSFEIDPGIDFLDEKKEGEVWVDELWHSR